MRVLWAACAQPGSLFPAVPIAQELLARGHAVTAMGDASAEATFSSLGVRFVPSLRRDAVGETGLTDPELSVRRAWHRAYVAAWYADVSEALHGGEYDVVMVDPLEPGADFAAEADGLPSFSYCHWAMDEEGADLFFTTHLWSGTEPASDEFVRWWNGERVAVGLSPDPRPPLEHRWYRQSRSLSVVLGLPELVHPSGELPSYARRVGPTVWSPPSDDPLPAALDRRSSDRPTILASVSTVGPASQDLVGALADAVRGEDVDVLLTVPQGAPCDGLPPNVVALPFLPHDARFLERVDLVVTQAGLGTVTRAACAGLPMLLLPRWGDQFSSARGAVHAGVALALQPDEINGPSLRKALRTLRSDPAYTARAKEVATAARSYDARRRAVDEVEALVSVDARD